MIAAYVDSRPPEPAKEVAAEPGIEAELLDLMRKHCQKSWQATRWLLEMTFPEKYGKRKGSAPAGPSVDPMRAAVSGVLTEEIADGAHRGTARQPGRAGVCRRGRCGEAAKAE